MMKNLFLKVVAILSAIVFWFIVISLENNFYIFPEPLEIQAFNLPENLVVQGDLGTAQITLKAAPRDATKLSNKDFEVYVDLKNSTEGERQAEITVSSKNPEVQILKVEPSVIKLTLEELKEKAVPLVYEIKGRVAENYQVKEVKLPEKEIIIKGSREELAKASEVQAIITLTGTETSNFSTKAPIIIADSEGKSLVRLSTDIEEVAAEVFIEQGIQTKTVGIEPVITGELDSAYISQIKISPTTVQIKGSNNNLRSITSIQTLPINVSNLKSGQPYNATLNLPPNTALGDGNSRTVTVTATIQVNYIEQLQNKENQTPSTSTEDANQ